MKNDKNPSLKNISGQPKNADEVINKYGTYQVQPTADSGNEFPEIAQGIPKKYRNKSIDKNDLKNT